MQNQNTIISDNTAPSSSTDNTIKTENTSEDETSTNSSYKTINKTDDSVLKTSSAKSTKITVNNITSKGYDTIVIKATVASGSSYVQSGLVAFKIDGKTVGHANVTNGKAILSYTLPGYSLGTYKISTIYGGTSTYRSSNNTGLLKVTKDTTNINIKTVTGNPGSKVRILAVIKSSKNTYAHGGTVSFKLNGLTIGSAKVSNGGAAINYTIPSSLSKNSYTITATYSGTGTYLSSKNSGTLVLVHPNNTKTTVSSVTTSKSTTVKINATVKTSAGKNVNGGTVAFKINGLTIGTAKVSGGFASISYTVPSTFSKTSYTITAVYSGNLNNKASNNSATLSIQTSNVPASMQKYLQATTNCQVNSQTIQDLAKKITAGYTSTLSKAKAIFNYLNDKTSYTYYSNTKYGALTTWNKKTGNCVDLTHLLIAVTRAAGIPAIYVHGKNCRFRSGLVVGHVWAKVYVDGTWYNCDISSNYNSFGKIVNWNSCSSKHEYTTLPF